MHIHLKGPGDCNVCSSEAKKLATATPILLRPRTWTLHHLFIWDLEPGHCNACSSEAKNLDIATPVPRWGREPGQCTVCSSKAKSLTKNNSCSAEAMNQALQSLGFLNPRTCTLLLYLLEGRNMATGNCICLFIWGPELDHCNSCSSEARTWPLPCMFIWAQEPAWRR